MSSGDQNSIINLGFAEHNEPWILKNRYFPSKIGGKPAWLDLKNLPTPDEIKCPKCNKPRIFLCQVYAPIDSREDCFHRTIFIFICRTETCNKLNSAENMIAFRNQIRRENDFYSSSAPDYDKEMPEIFGPNKLCDVCGCLGPFACSKCKKINYCSDVHQKLDWKNHKKFCKQIENNENAEVSETKNKTSEDKTEKNISESKIETKVNTENSISSTSSKVLFPEYEIVIEEEPEIQNLNPFETEENAEKRRLKEYQKLLKSGKIKDDLKDVPESELAELIPEGDEDKKFTKFKERIELCPEQVLRYDKNGVPLWITNNNVNQTLNVPNCENCKGMRIFEFQIMPQMLNYLKDDHIDWGILTVFTCLKSCNKNSNYIKEFILKQDISSKNETKK